MYLLHGMHEQTKNLILSNEAIEELDEYAFVEWKNELKRNLPNFWRSMNQT